MRVVNSILKLFIHFINLFFALKFCAVSSAIHAIIDAEFQIVSSNISLKKFISNMQT